jgi:hypothetical protein
MKTYTISEYGITVKTFPGPHGNGGSIVSKLRDHHITRAKTDAIESLILGHACAGLNISSYQYRKGLQSAVNALTNHL